MNTNVDETSNLFQMVVMLVCICIQKHVNDSGMNDKWINSKR